VVRTETLFRFVKAIVAASSRKAAWERAAGGTLSLSSGYRLWRRLKTAQTHIRTKLFAVCLPPPSSATEPWAQLVEHLSRAFSTTCCGFSAFQRHLQTGLMG
jgi:hypothetical protein